MSGRISGRKSARNGMGTSCPHDAGVDIALRESSLIATARSKPVTPSSSMSRNDG
eukprot:CAMPEP_0171120772 /NCGR_PEP_ID=MMETSP0766_2-20121228/100593_1 /TAXON_ID=439317 /ORGANISM="Gambierdiscus australes, Strain CAWD 149" /LENGTH=54 /DNA_ID=CAMNT_0011583521 /DNA_START=207 /DNA_END=368 /DNA_ORIENTATION=+